MQLKTGLRSAAIATFTLIVTQPFVAEAIPQKSRNACIRRTAEEMGVPTSDVRITNVGPVSAESGATTLSMENRQTGETAECRVSTIDNTVLSVDVTGGGSASQGDSVPTEGSFSGKGRANGAVFGGGRQANASLDFNRGRFSLSLYVPSGTGAQVQYQGKITRLESLNQGNPNSFTLEGRMENFASSANNLQVVNTSGTCRIEVSDARITSTSCSTSRSSGTTRFVGMSEF